MTFAEPRSRIGTSLRRSDRWLALASRQGLAPRLQWRKPATQLTSKDLRRKDRSCGTARRRVAARDRREPAEAGAERCCGMVGKPRKARKQRLTGACRLRHPGGGQSRKRSFVVFDAGAADLSALFASRTHIGRASPRLPCAGIGFGHVIEQGQRSHRGRSHLHPDAKPGYK